MKWLKKGRIFKPEGNLKWMVSHAALPAGFKIADNIFRIYCSGRDNQGRSQIGFFEINLEEPSKILYITEEPVLTLGPLGTFDDRGLTNSWIIKHNGCHYLYYSGWSLGVTVPFYFYIGLAISEDGGLTFKKVSNAPILDRNPIDPYLTASPCIVIQDNIWKMWYVSGVKWEIENGKPKHYYHIKYAQSNNGIDWVRSGTVCIDFKSKDEYAIARPCVIVENDIYKMWYCYRGKSYKIGYAESNDGMYWHRKDESVGISTSSNGWDSEMIAYPYVFKHKGNYYMLYNGNGYGKSGIGLAILSTEM